MLPTSAAFLNPMSTLLSLLWATIPTTILLHHYNYCYCWCSTLLLFAYRRHWCWCFWRWSVLWVSKFCWFISSSSRSPSPSLALPLPHHYTRAVATVASSQQPPTTIQYSSIVQSTKWNWHRHKTKKGKVTSIDPRLLRMTWRQCGRSLLNFYCCFVLCCCCVLFLFHPLSSRQFCQVELNIQTITENGIEKE